MVVKVGFGKALRTLSDLADAVVASGAMTEMSGAEFITYAARQLAVASTEPKDEAACRIAALKAAIVTADEQTRGPTPASDICVFVKVYDSDTAEFSQIESAITQCKSTISALRLANVGTPAYEGANDDYEEAEIAPEPRRGVRQSQAAEPAPRRQSFHDDDPDADDWEAEHQTTGSSYDDEEVAPSYEVDEDADADELDQHMKALAGVQITPPRPARTSRQSRGSKPQAPAAPARKRGRAPLVQTARGIAKPRRIPMPRPMSPAELATAVRQGHGDRHQSRISSSLA